MIDRTSLRLSATLLLVGQLLYIVVTLFHTGGDANNHPAIFAAYAGSGIWTAVHLGQFAAMAILLAGLLALFFALDLIVLAYILTLAWMIWLVVVAWRMRASEAPASGR